MSQKRRADWAYVEDTSAIAKRQRTSGSGIYAKQRAYEPRQKYKPHADSGIGKDFHSVPYPLSLIPKKSWEALNEGDVKGSICSECGKERDASPYQRKLFLVAERLSWELGTSNRQQKEQNEVALWAVNADLDVFDPAVEDEELVIGGRHSRVNEWYPFHDQVEAALAMKIVEKADILSETSWAVWHSSISPGNTERKPLAELDSNSSQSPQRPPRKDKGKDIAVPESSLPTPPSSDPPHEALDLRKRSFETLPEFYSVLDKLERTSSMGAWYLEAYAERLHVDVCQACWFKNTIIDVPDEEEDDGDVSSTPQNAQVAGGHIGERVRHEPMRLSPQMSIQQPTQASAPRSMPYGAASTHRNLRQTGDHAALPSTAPFPTEAPPATQPMTIGASHSHPIPLQRQILPKSAVPLGREHTMYSPAVPTGGAVPHSSHNLPLPIQPAPVATANPTPQQGQANEWLERHFVADATTHTSVTVLWQTYRDTFPGVPRLGHADFVPAVLSTFASCRSEYLLDGTYVVKGIRQKSLPLANEASAQNKLKSSTTTRADVAAQPRPFNAAASTSAQLTPTTRVQNLSNPDPLVAMPEPSRSAKWLQNHCLPDPYSEILLVPLYDAYIQDFSTRNCLRAMEFLDCMRQTFPSPSCSIAQNSSDAWMMKGLKLRTSVAGLSPPQQQLLSEARRKSLEQALDTSTGISDSVHLWPMPEPMRSSVWLQDHYLMDPDNEILQMTMYAAYQQSFAASRRLNGPDFISSIERTFPAASIARNASGLYVIKGLKPKPLRFVRSAPVVPQLLPQTDGPSKKNQTGATAAPEANAKTSLETPSQLAVRWLQEHFAHDQNSELRNTDMWSTYTGAFAASNRLPLYELVDLASFTFSVSATICTTCRYTVLKGIGPKLRAASREHQPTRCSPPPSQQPAKPHEKDEAEVSGLQDITSATSKQTEAANLSTMGVENPAKKELRIIVEAKDKPQVPMTVSMTTPISTIIKYVKKKMEISSDQIVRLHLDGELLSPEITVRDSDIEDMETLDLVVDDTRQAEAVVESCKSWLRKQYVADASAPRIRPASVWLAYRSICQNWSLPEKEHTAIPEKADFEELLLEVHPSATSHRAVSGVNIIKGLRPRWPTVEPERTSAWLASNFVADPLATTTKSEIWQAYRDDFTPANSEVPILRHGELFVRIRRKFPDSSAAYDRSAHEFHIVKGMRRRTQAELESA